MSAAKTAWTPRLARRAERMKASEIRELLKLLDQPDIISFAGGIPDPRLFPVEEAKAAYASALATPEAAAQALQYSVSEGYPPLRAWIAEHMGRLGVPCAPENIVVVAGSQQALDFLGKLLVSPSDTILVQAPTYLGALQAFSAYEPRYDRLRPEDGNETAASYRQSAGAAGGEAKMAYLVPDFANPTGETLSLAGRKRVLALAEELDIPIVEDTAYTALRYDGRAVPAIQALDVAAQGGIDRSRVIYCGTFSKTVAPSLRVGWVCASRDIVQRLVLIKQASDLNVSAINQMVMHRLVTSGYEERIAKARETYRARRDAMLAALKRHMPKGVSWSKPEGGLFVWVTLPKGEDGAKLLERSVKEAKVAFVPGAAFFADGSGRNTIRLSFSLPPPATIETGVARLAALLK